MRATLISKYFNIEVKVNITNEKADLLKKMDSATAMEWINEDLEYFKHGFKPNFLTASAAKRINHFFAKDDYNYFNQIVF